MTDPHIGRITAFGFRIMNWLNRHYERYRVEKLISELGHCGQRVYLSPHCIIWNPAQMTLGDDVHIHGLTHIFAGGGVEIGAGTMISACCSITSVTHPVVGRNRLSLPLILQPVIIGKNVWVGTGAIILPGVVIGDDAVIGAGSVVTGDVPPRVVVLGSPARVVREIEPEDLGNP